MRQIIFIILIVPLFFTCTSRRQINFGNSKTGYIPIYAPNGDLSSVITAMPAKAMESTGKIYIYNKYLFVVEPYYGVHVFDNANPSLPVSVVFIKIPGAQDVIMRKNYLYADYFGNIAVIDVTDFHNPRVVQKVDFDNYTYAKRPPPVPREVRDYGRILFECTDETKGKVIGWIPTQDTKNMKCYLQ